MPTNNATMKMECHDLFFTLYHYAERGYVDGVNEIFNCVEEGDKDTILGLFAKNPVKNYKGALCIATENGHDKVVEVLLSHLDEEAVRHELRIGYMRYLPTPANLLNIAISKGHDGVVSQLVATAADAGLFHDVIFSGYKGFPDTCALYLAASKGNYNVVVELTEVAQGLGDENETLKKMLVPTKDMEHGPLYAAVENGNAVVITWLINVAKRVGDESATLKQMLYSPKENPLVIAARKGNVEAVTLLIEAAQKLDDNNQTLKQMLYSSKENPLFIAARKGNVEVVTLLIEAAQNLNDDNQTLKQMLYSSSKESLMTIAITYDNPDVVNALVTCAEDLKIIGSILNLDIVCIAAEYNRFIIISQLIEAAKNLNDDNQTLKQMLVATTNKKGPLSVAARTGAVSAVKCLITAARDLGDSNNATLKQMLLQREGLCAPLVIAAGSRRKEVVVQLMIGIQYTGEPIAKKLCSHSYSRLILDALRWHSNEGIKVGGEIFLKAILEGEILAERLRSQVRSDIKSLMIAYFRRNYSHDEHADLMNEGNPLRKFMATTRLFKSDREQILLDVFKQKKKDHEVHCQVFETEREGAGTGLGVFKKKEEGYEPAFQTSETAREGAGTGSKNVYRTAIAYAFSGMNFERLLRPEGPHSH